MFKILGAIGDLVVFVGSLAAAIYTLFFLHDTHGFLLWTLVFGMVRRELRDEGKLGNPAIVRISRHYGDN